MSEDEQQAYKKIKEKIKELEDAKKGHTATDYTLAKFFEDWGRLCELSQTNFLDTNDMEGTINWTAFDNNKCYLNYLE